MFKPGFLDYLRDFRAHVNIDAVPEGELVFPREPMVRVTGPALECQLLETALLNIVGFQTLVATKTARVVLAADGRPVAEFGLRRAQGPDGGLAVARASYVAGCSSTSNVLAGRRYGIPVFGTHAHSWVMSFDSELEAFRAFAKSSPKNCTLLIDTYDVREGCEHAITVAKEMEAVGERLSAIRIDSGDLAKLSKYVRGRFDAEGLPYVGISVSNDLDEYTIQSLLDQRAHRQLWRGHQTRDLLRSACAGRRVQAFGPSCERRGAVDAGGEAFRAALQAHDPRRAARTTLLRRLWRPGLRHDL